MRDLSVHVSGQIKDRFSGVPAPLPARKTSVPLPGMSLWLDAAEVSTIALSGENVLTWSDKSGFGATATASNNYPYYGGAGARSMNGIVCVEWHTVGLAPGLTVPAISRGDRSQTCYVACLFDSISGSMTTMLGPSNEQGANFCALNSGGHNGLYCEGWLTGGGRAFQSNAAVPIGSPVVCVQRIAATTIMQGVNGVWEVDNESGSFQNHYLVIGGNKAPSWIGNQNDRPMDGLFGEILIYDAIHTDEEVKAVERYLMDKWGVA